MSLFDSAIQSDATFLFNGDGMTESIEVKDVGSTTWRDIEALVNRTPPDAILPDGTVMTPMMRLTVANSATVGIDSSTMQSGGNIRVRMARRKGGDAEEFGLYLPPEGSRRAHNAGMISFDVR